MGLAAISFAIVTILIGTLVLADLGGRPGARRYVGVHVAVALTGSVVVAVAAFSTSPGVAAGALVVLLLAAAMGILTWRRTSADPDPVAGKVSNGMLVAHGAGAALTIVFIALAAARL